MSKTDKSTLGDYLKEIERSQNSEMFDNNKWIYCRIDGRHFSSLTKNSRKPFDIHFSESMQYLTDNLMSEFNANIGYVQSDEISLVWKPVSGLTERPFNGKKQKWYSVIPSFCASVFTETPYVKYCCSDGSLGKLPRAHFDARFVELSEEIDVIKFLYWRHIDARKNAVSMIAQNTFSHNFLNNKNTGKKVALLEEKGIKLEDFNPSHLYGTLKHFKYVNRTVTETKYIKVPMEIVRRKIINTSTGIYNLNDYISLWDKIKGEVHERF